MGRKAFSQIRARVDSGQVCLSAYLTTPRFQGGVTKTAGITVHRLRLDEFVFGNDYAEFFQGLSPAAASVVFRGEIQLGNGRKVAFVDDTAEMGGVYAYWFAPDEAGAPCTGPIQVKVRDPRVWWSHETICQRLRALASDHPDLVEARSFGQTVQGREILGCLVGNRERMLGMVGLIHAGESGPELQIPAVEQLLRDDPELLRQVGVAILPDVDADQRQALAAGNPWYLRTNASGVDLNRNFAADWDETHYGYGLDSSDPDAMTYRGQAPNSEPETQAVLAFVEAFQPVAVFSHHCLASICGDSFLVSEKAAGDEAFAAMALPLAQAYRDGMYPDSPGETSLHFGCSSGSLPHYLYLQGVPCYDLELGSNEDARPCVRDETTPELLATYQARHAGGLAACLRSLAE